MSIQEGLDLLLQVADYIKAQGRTDVHFTCVGGGPGARWMRQMVKDMKLEDTVNFTGRVPDEQLLDILSTADVCVNPDKPCEMNDISTMIKIMEYMALGKPIVQFDLKEGRFSAGEASLYADKRTRFLILPQRFCGCSTTRRTKKMGMFGYSRVQKELAWEFSVKNFWLLMLVHSASAGAK